jgi:hypothetical protein
MLTTSIKKWLIRPRLIRLAAALAIAVAATTVVAAPAHAASVWAAGDRIIINVQTGDKNTSNHTQWVSSIYVEASTSAANTYGCGTFEAWTQGFYASTVRCGTAFWNISRSVGTGNYVCGAFTDIDRGWPRTIACIAIRV